MINIGFVRSMGKLMMASAMLRIRKFYLEHYDLMLLRLIEIECFCNEF